MIDHRNHPTFYEIYLFHEKRRPRKKMPWKTAMYFNQKPAPHVEEFRQKIAHYTSYKWAFDASYILACRRHRKNQGGLSIHLHLAKYQLKEVST
jgi:hypothetical protein